MTALLLKIRLDVAFIVSKRGSMMTGIYKLGFITLAVCAVAGCAQSGGATQFASHRYDLNKEYGADVNAKMKDLAPADAQFVGTMEMIKSHQRFDAILTVKRIYENQRTDTSADPTQTINVPKLSGSMRFPALDHMSVPDYNNFSEIIEPLGGFSVAIFDFGDYIPATHILTLPYNVSGYSQGNFGELSGTLQDGVFEGTWFAKPFGIVGKFKFVKTSLGTGN